MAKSVILPIITTIALAIQLIFDVEIPDEVLNDLALSIANLVAVGVTIYGVVKNYDKRDKKDKTEK